MLNGSVAVLTSTNFDSKDLELTVNAVNISF